MFKTSVKQADNNIITNINGIIVSLLESLSDF